MIKILFLSFITLLITSCASFKAPEFKGSDGMKFESIDGKKLLFTAGFQISNPNWYGVKIKKSDLDFYLEDKYIGKIYLDKKVKLKPKSDATVVFPLYAILEDGAMITLVRYSNKENVSVRFAGKIKGGVFVFSKKIEINETRTISGKKLRQGLQK